MTISWKRAALLSALTIGATLAPMAGATDHSAFAASAAADDGIYITVDLSQRKLRIKQGDSTLQAYDVSVGQPKWPTPPGEYSIRKIVWNPSWIPPDASWAKDKQPQDPGARANPMKVVKIFFREPAYYIHGTGDLESLGEAESHGCLRMDPDDAYRVARYLMDHGGQPRDESWFWRVLHFRSETKTVYLDHPISMSVSS